MALQQSLVFDTYFKKVNKIYLPSFPHNMLLGTIYWEEELLWLPGRSPEVVFMFISLSISVVYLQGYRLYIYSACLLNMLTYVSSILSPVEVIFGYMYRWFPAFSSLRLTLG